MRHDLQTVEGGGQLCDIFINVHMRLLKGNKEAGMRGYRMVTAKVRVEAV